MAIQLDQTQFSSKINKVFTFLKNQQNSNLLICSSEKTVYFHLWLFGYEFPDSFFYFFNSKLVIFTSQKKAEIFKTLNSDFIKIIKRQKLDEFVAIDEFVKEVLFFQNNSSKQVSTADDVPELLKDSSDFTKKVLEKFIDFEFEKISLSSLTNEKDVSELVLLIN